MNVEIRVDAPGALPTIAAVESGLEKVGAKAPAVGDAVSKALGAGAPAADKTKQSTESLAAAMTKLANAGSAFTGFDQVFKREADMLEKINGPAREYLANLQALDSLLAKNSISTDQYAQQVTKLNTAIDGVGQKAEQAKPPSDGLSGAIGALAAPAIATAIIGIGEKIEGLIRSYEQLEDQYTVLENKALTFADSLHSANQILDEQQQLSIQLHSTMGPVSDVYQRVREGSDDLRISHEEQIRVTKTLAEAVQLSNKPLEETTGLMARLTYALETGTLSGGEFKRMAKDVPELADLWAKHWSVSIDQLKHMVEEGKVGPRDLMNAMIVDFHKVDADFDKRKATNEQKMAEWKESVAKDMGEGMNGYQAVFLNGIDKDADASFKYQIKYGAEGDDKLAEDRGKAAIQQVLEQVNDVKNLTGEYRSLGDAQDAASKKMFQNMINLIPETKALGQAVLDLGSSVGVMTDAWEHGLTPFGRTMKIVMDNAAKVGDAKQQLTALSAAMKQGGLAGDAARKQYEELMTTINDGRLPATIKIWDSLHEPVRTAREDLAATNELWKANSISSLDYQYELLQLAKADPGLQRFNEVLADSVKRYDEAAAAAKKYREASQYTATPGAVGLDTQTFAGPNRQALSDAAVFKGAQVTSDAAQDEQAKRYLDVLTENATAVDKYRDELLKLNEVQQQGSLTGDKYATYLTNLKEKYGAVVSPAEKFAKEMSDARDLRDASIITEGEYLKRIQDVAKEQEKLADSGKNFTSGLSRGWHSIRDEAQDSASTIASSMKGAFDEINSDIVSMVTTGTADWGKLESTIEADFAKIALQRVEGSLFSAVSGGSEGAAAGVATGTSASTTMLAAAPTIGAAIGAAAASAIAVGSAASSGASDALSAGASAVAGSWAGSDTMIHAANGYAGKVRGVAGTDTKLFAAMVTPGESVAIRTPAQQTAEARGSSNQRPINVHYHDDTRAQLKSYVAGGDADVELLSWAKRNKNSLKALTR